MKPIQTVVLAALLLGCHRGTIAAAAESLSASQVFAEAESAISEGRNEDAEAIYRALTHDPDADLRSEARYRLGLLFERLGRQIEAAVLYRAILDEKPDAQRVRLELAKVLLAMGDDGGARRALRQAQAGGLPRDVQQLVDQFQGALRAIKPLGGSLEFSMAPNSNINRATRSATLDTVLAPFELSKDAREQSGVGAKLAGQGYVRLPIGEALRWITTVSGQGLFYRRDNFNDVIAAVDTGVEATRGRSRLRPAIARTYRWYGGRTYTVTDMGSLNWLRSVGRQSQLEANIGAGRANYRQNHLQDGGIYTGSLSFEHAFSARSGGRVGVSVQRQDARDPGYALTGGGGNLLYWHDYGRATLFGTLALDHIEADDRLFLFPHRRVEWLVRAAAGATLRQKTLWGFAPVIRGTYERNVSTVGLYDYSRLGIELGVSRAF